MSKLKNKVAIITGSSSGIGKEIALLYAKEGAKVVVVAGRNLDGAKNVVNEIESTGGIAIALQADMSKLEDIQKLIKDTIEVFGTIDVLVNNAGILDNFTMASNVTEELWDNVLDVNTKAVMRTMREVLPIFEEKQNGVIINIGSISSIAGSRGGLAYTASKYAVIGMTKNVAFQYSKKGIRCNAIAPGGVITNIHNTITAPDMEGAKLVREGAALMPRLGQAEEIAKAALFLASNDSSFVNGDVLVADGGWSAY